MKKEMKYFKIITLAILMICACYFTYPSTNSRYIKDGVFSYDTNFYKLYYDYRDIGASLKLRKDSSNSETAHFRLTFYTNPSVKDASSDVYSLVTVPNTCEVEYINEPNFVPVTDYVEGSKLVGANIYCSVNDLLQEDGETVKLDVSVKEKIEEGRVFTYTDLSWSDSLSNYLISVYDKVEEFDIVTGLTKKDFYEQLQNKLILYAQSKNPSTELSIALKTYINEYLFGEIITDDMLTEEIITQKMIDEELKIPFISVSLEQDHFHFEVLKGFDSYGKTYKELSFDNHQIMTFKDISSDDINEAFKYYVEHFTDFTTEEKNAILKHVNKYSGTTKNGMEALINGEINQIPGIIDKGDLNYSFRLDILDYVNPVVEGNKVIVKHKKDTNMIEDFRTMVKENLSDIISSEGVDFILNDTSYYYFVLSLVKNNISQSPAAGNFVDYYSYYDSVKGHYVFIKVSSDVGTNPENAYNEVEFSIYPITDDVKISFANGSLNRLQIKISNSDASKIIATVGKLDEYFGITTDISALTITDKVTYIISKEIIQGVNNVYSNEDVTVTIADNNLESVMVNGVSKTITDHAYTETFTDNGEYTVIAKSKQYSREVTFIIDKVNPTITGITDQQIVSSPVSITYQDDNLSYIVVNGTKKEIDALTLTETYSELGSYIISATDKAGNTTEITFTIE